MTLAETDATILSAQGNTPAANRSICPLVRSASRRKNMGEPTLAKPEPPYPYFWRTAIQREKKRWHNLLLNIERQLLPSLRRWKHAYKSSHGSLVKENRVLRERIASLERRLQEKDAQER